MLGKKMICYENETDLIVLGQNDKNKCVGNLFIYCYKVFFEERYTKKLLPTSDVYLNFFFILDTRNIKKSRYI